MNDVNNVQLPVLPEWWKHLGFEDKPFPTPTAESEPRLLNLWLAPSNYTNYFNDVDHKSVLVTAPRGVGKSAIKKYLYLQFESRKFNQPEFVVPVADFSEFLDEKGEVSNVTAGAHCRKLLIHYVWELCYVLMEREDLLMAKCEPTALRRLVTLAAAFPPPGGSQPEREWAARHFLQRHGRWYHNYIFNYKSSQHLETRARVIRWISGLIVRLGLPSMLLSGQPHKEPAITYIRELWTGVAKPLGYERLLFIVNRIDEPDENAKERNYDVDTTLKISKPLLELIRDGSAFQKIDGVAIKILLWDAVAPRLSTRTGKYNVGKIYWTDQQIAELLRRRLHAYSRGEIKDVSSIVEPSAQESILSLLIRYSQRIPRLLNLILARAFENQTEQLRRRRPLTSSRTESVHKQQGY
jgi:hypothetical protein